MKYLFISTALFFAVTSCGGGSCDTSSPEGAADCACGYVEELKAAFESKDEAALKDLETKMGNWETEVEKHIEAGDYTENDVEAALEAKKCDL